MPPRSPEPADAPDRLSDLCGEGFALIIQLRSAHDFGSPERLRQRVLEMLGRFERAARKSGQGTGPVEDAQFALVAFIDETLQASDWHGKDFWMAQPLQLELYDRYDAGEEFFTRLERLRTQPESHADVLEVYYLCLALGFKGRYHLHEQARLRYLIEDLYNELQGTRAKAGPLAPHGYRRDGPAETAREGWPLWMIGAGLLAVAVVFYLIMSLVVSGTANGVAETMNGV